MDDYEYYKLGCKVEGERSIGRKRFLAAALRYERDRHTAMARIDAAADRRRSMRLIVQWTRLELVMAVLKSGKIAAGVLEPDKVTASYGEHRPDDIDRSKPWTEGDWDAGAPGVREPRRPVAPILVAAAARSLEAAVYEYDRTSIH